MQLPPGYPDFYHYKPIEYLLGLNESEIEQLPGLDAALQMFESVFRDLNALIPSTAAESS